MITKAEAQEYSSKRDVTQVELWVKNNEGNIDHELKCNRLQAYLMLPYNWTVTQRQLALKLISEKYTLAGWYCQLYEYPYGESTDWAISVAAEKPKSFWQRIFGKRN